MRSVMLVDHLQISNLRARGQTFLKVPKKYYDNLREALKTSKCKVAENMDEVSVSSFLHNLSVAMAKLSG